MQCKKAGHMISECPEPNLGPDGKPRERYVPEEDPDLYGSRITCGSNFTNFERTPLMVCIQITLFILENKNVVDTAIFTIGDGQECPQHYQNLRRCQPAGSGHGEHQKIGLSFSYSCAEGCHPGGSRSPRSHRKCHYRIGKNGKLGPFFFHLFIYLFIYFYNEIEQLFDQRTSQAAFLVPVVNILLEKGCPGGSMNPVQQPEVVIIAPTRELAIQIYNEARKFANNSVLKPVIIYGGTVVSHQLNQLQRGCNILVATPGRLKHFVQDGHLNFSNVQFLILDEADRMLDMGFGEDIQFIAGHQTMNPTVAKHFFIQNKIKWWSTSSK